MRALGWVPSAGERWNRERRWNRGRVSNSRSGEPVMRALGWVPSAAPPGGGQSFPVADRIVSRPDNVFLTFVHRVEGGGRLGHFVFAAHVLGHLLHGLAQFVGAGDLEFGQFVAKVAIGVLVIIAHAGAVRCDDTAQVWAFRGSAQQTPKISGH